MGKPFTAGIVAACIIGLITVSCRMVPGPQGKPGGLPEITNYPAPEFTIDAAPFSDAGCPLNEYGHRICLEGSPLLALGCWKLQVADDLLGGLQPRYAMVECVLDPNTSPRDDSGIPYIYNNGCSRPILIRYAIFDGSSYQVLASKADLQAAYAPIESEAEALSYALAATGYRALYGLQAEKGIRYFVDSLADTRVEKVEEGYLAHLFYYKLCGCGPHPTASVIFLVTPAGDIKELSFEILFEDPQQDDLCAD